MMGKSKKKRIVRAAMAGAAASFAAVIFAAMIATGTWSAGQKSGIRETTGAGKKAGLAEPYQAAQSAGTLKTVKKDLGLYSMSAVLIDADTGRVLYGKDENTPRPMASTTKIMTCIVALENCGLDEEVEVSSYAASMPDVQLGIREGENYRLGDLLYSMMLESHNDSAAAIAEHVAGSREYFADMMNRKARELGLTSTYFITPNGLDAKDEATGNAHSTTAKELAKILRYCIMLSPKREDFLAITRTPSHSFSDISGTRFFSCMNHNALLTSMDGALTGKTGFTGGAGYCYVGAVKKNGRTFIAALLGCGWPPHKTYKWQDMKKLIGYGEENYQYRTIELKKIDLEPAAVINGIDAECGLFVEYPKVPELKLLMREGEHVTVRTKVSRSLTAPVEEGQVAGQADYYLGDTLVASFPVKTTRKIREWTWEFCAKTLLKSFFF